MSFLVFSFYRGGGTPQTPSIIINIAPLGVRNFAQKFQKRPGYGLWLPVIQCLLSVWCKHQTSCSVQVFAHELGHSLGMYHDFAGNGNRQEGKDKSGNNCKGIGGIMDYNGPMETWTQCSREDMADYFTSLSKMLLNCKGGKF